MDGARDMTSLLDATAGPYQQARFVTGAASPARLPDDVGREAAFVGRSNSGKSSSINAIAGRRGLARTSRTPGRTQQINFFDLGRERRLVDLPGYGYARVPERVRQDWKPLVEGYLTRRRSLVGLILTVDVRRDPGDLDAMLIDWCHQAALPVHVLLTKADKLGRGANARALIRWERFLRADGQATVQLFSALSRLGVDAARERLAGWLDFRKKAGPV